MKKFLTIALIYLLPFCLLVYLLVHAFSSPKTNVYTKIAQGQPISILIAGDSIGAGSGASKPEFNFANRLKSALQQKYSVTATVVNVSMGGNTTYAPLIRVFKLNKNHDFDLAIICSGENDYASTLGPYYEALIRNIKTKYPNAEIISILQSSQKTYTDKIKTIQTIAKHYNIPTADTIIPFTNGENGTYSTLTVDGIHPTNKGYALYAQTLETLIDQNVQNNTKAKQKLPSPIFPDALNHACFQELSTNQLTRTENTFTGQIGLPKNSFIGMEVNFITGTNSYEVQINKKRLAKYNFYWEFPGKHFITDIAKTAISGPRTISITFDSTKQADSFKGLFVTHPTPKN